MKEKVQKALETLRAGLQSHGGDVEFVDVTEDGVVKVRLMGHCAGCPHARITISEFIEAELKRAVPEVTSVEAV